MFRDGKPVITGDPIPVSLEGQPDLARITGVSLVQLGGGLPPGEYVMQVVVTDASKQKARVATQWIDFEVIK